MTSWQMSSRADALYAEAIESYRTIYPSGNIPVDPVARIRSDLALSARGGEAPGFTDLVAQLFAAIAATEGVELSAISYNADVGQMTATLRFAGYEPREALKQAFDQFGLILELGASRQSGGLITGDVMIGAGR